MVLSEMVAEDRTWEEEDDDAGDEVVGEVVTAVGGEGSGKVAGSSGSSALSQGELVSVLREGMTAILTEQEAGGQMTDIQLDRLLERGGRDNTIVEVSAASKDDDRVVDICSDGAALPVQEVLLTSLPQVCIHIVT